MAKDKITRRDLNEADFFKKQIDFYLSKHNLTYDDLRRKLGKKSRSSMIKGFQSLKDIPIGKLVDIANALGDFGIVRVVFLRYLSADELVSIARRRVAQQPIPIIVTDSLGKQLRMIFYKRKNSENLTIMDIAARLGHTEANVRRYFRDDTTYLALQTIQKLTDILNVSIVMQPNNKWEVRDMKPLQKN